MLTLLAALDIRCLAVAITSASWYVDRRCWRSGTHTPYQRPGSRYLHPGVLQGLCRGDPLLGVQGEELLDQVDGWEHEKEQQKESSLLALKLRRECIKIFIEADRLLHFTKSIVSPRIQLSLSFPPSLPSPPSPAYLPSSPAYLPPSLPLQLTFLSSLPPSVPPSLPLQPTFLGYFLPVLLREGVSSLTNLVMEGILSDLIRERRVATKPEEEGREKITWSVALPSRGSSGRLQTQVLTAYMM